MSNEFEPTTLENVLDPADDGQQVAEEPAPAEEVKEETVEEPKQEEVKEEVKDETKEDQASNFAELRNVVKDLKAQLKEKESVSEEKPQEKEALPDPLEDPEGYAKRMKDDTNEIVSKSVLSMSEKMMRMQHSDYDEKLDRVLKEAETNPGIQAQLAASEHPAMTAYEIGQKLLQLDDIGDPAEFKKRVEAEVRAELAKDKASNENIKLPDDLTSETNAGARKVPVFSGPTSLDAALRKK